MTTDITNLTDAALDVFLDVKSGADCVLVGHLTPAERLSVCEALGVTARNHWITAAPYETRKLEPKFVARDVEGMILDRQDREVEGEVA
jgi:hypothetical protein